jgi:hypothetical protein
MKNLYLTLAIVFGFSAAYAQNAPVDFEAGSNGASWTWTVFENDDNPPLNIIANPDMTGANTSATVAEFTARVTGQPFAGTESMHGADLGSFTLSNSNSLIKIMVWKTEISDVGIKLVEASGASLPEIKVANTLVNQWEELTFNFSSMEGTTFDQIVVFPDFNARAQENIIYFDNIVFDMQDPNNTEGCTDDTASNYNASATTDDGSCVFSMTFNVDMNCYNGDDPNIDANAPTTFTTVSIEGPSLGWCGSCVELSDPDMDGIWSITLDLPAGNFEYKYAHDTFAGQEQLVDDVQAGTGGCAPVTDGSGFANRLVTVAAGSVFDDVYGSCSLCDPNNTAGCMDPTAVNFNPNATVESGLCSYAVTFSVDMNAVTDPFVIAEVNGSFNGWCGGCNPLSDNDSDGIWEGTINIQNGDYEFKFAADSWGIEEALTDGSPCTNTTDTFINRTLSVTGNMTYGPVAWNACPVNCPEDINGDGVVDINDFLALNSGFGQACTCPEDINSDGVVDINDFLSLNSAFGSVCN